MAAFTLKNGIQVSANSARNNADIPVVNGKISASAEANAPQINLNGKSYVYPALVNTHDHLRGNYLPQCGPAPGTYYLTWLPWDNDLKASPCYAERTKALDINKGYELSGYKTLFSGVVTVNDHFPHALNKDLLPTLPVRAIQNYAIAHECSSYELKWGGDIKSEHDIAVKNGWPFITHLAEGFDDESMDGLPTLERNGALDNHCLLVHCLGFSDEDIAKTAQAGASLAWCGVSNMFMFNTTCKIKKFMDAGVNVTIASDSSHTGAYNLLKEIKADRALYRRMYGDDLSAKTIFDMVTVNAARALWMDGETGSLDAGKRADILVAKAKHDDAYENFVAMDSRDIELLTKDGVPVWGEMRFLDLLGGGLPENYSSVKIDGRMMFVAGDPLALYNHIRSAIGFRKVLDFLPFEPDEQ